MSDNNLIAKIDGLKSKFKTLQEQIADPSLMNDMKRYVQRRFSRTRRMKNLGRWQRRR